MLLALLTLAQLLGRLMGVAIRTRNPLPLELPSCVWKPLVGQQVRSNANYRMVPSLMVILQVTLADIALVDHCVVQSWETIEKMDEATFNASVFENWEGTLRYRYSNHRAS